MEKYIGIKFNYKNIGKTISKHYLLPELKYWCSLFNKKELAPRFSGGSSGNLSFRIKPGENRFIITASSTALSDNMSDKDFTEVISYDEINNIIYGKGLKQPSSESIMHFLIYKNRPDINAVFHGHSEEILRKAADLNIPITENEYEYGSPESAVEASELLRNNNFIIIKNHGFIASEISLQKAGEQTENILLNCKSVK